MEVDSKPFRNWWSFFKEVWTLTSLSAEMPGEWEMGTFAGEKGMEERKAFGSVRAWEQLGAVGPSSQRQAGQRGDKENRHTRSLQGRRCGDHYLLLGCWHVEDGCERDWDAETWTFMAEWVGKALLTVCIALGGSEHHQYLQNTSNWYS